MPSGINEKYTPPIPVTSFTQIVDDTTSALKTTITTTVNGVTQVIDLAKLTQKYNTLADLYLIPNADRKEGIIYHVTDNAVANGDKVYIWEQVFQYFRDISSVGVTNLSLGTATSTTVPVNSSTGTAAILSSATITTAGLLSSNDKIILDGLATGSGESATIGTGNTPIIPTANLANWQLNTVYVFNANGTLTTPITLADGTVLSTVEKGASLKLVKTGVSTYEYILNDAFDITTVLDGNHRFINRNNATVSVPPSPAEILTMTPIRGMTASVFLTDKKIENWTYTTSWILTNTILPTILDGNDRHLVRANSTLGVLPTLTEIPAPINGMTAKVFLSNGTIEYDSYNGTTWVIDRTVLPTILDGNDIHISRANSTLGVLPTIGEVPTPVLGDTAKVFLLDGTIEYDSYNGTTWVIDRTVLPLNVVTPTSYTTIAVQTTTTTANQITQNTNNGDTIIKDVIGDSVVILGSQIIEGTTITANTTLAATNRPTIIKVTGNSMTVPVVLTLPLANTQKQPLYIYKDNSTPGIASFKVAITAGSTNKISNMLAGVEYELMTGTSTGDFYTLIPITGGYIIG